MQCPIDNTSCNTQQFDDIQVDVCPKCDGVWFENRELARLVQNLQIPKYTQSDDLLKEWEVAVSTGSLPKDFWKEDTLECPNGHGQMSKHFYAGSSIGIDQCQTCKGVWLDGGELHAVAEYVEPNFELDRAWQEAIREQVRFQNATKELELLPARIAQFAVTVTTLPMMFAVLAGFVAQALVEGLMKSQEELRL